MILSYNWSKYLFWCSLQVIFHDLSPCCHTSYLLRLVWWCYVEFPAFISRCVLVLPRLSLVLWRATMIPLADWINFCFTLCTDALIVSTECRLVWFIHSDTFCSFNFLIFPMVICLPEQLLFLFYIFFSQFWRSFVITMRFNTKHDPK